MERRTPSEKLSSLSDFQIRYIRFWVQQEEITAEVPEQKTDAFTVLMASATELKLPGYLAGNTMKDKLFNDLCDLLSEKDLGFPVSMQSVGLHRTFKSN